MKELPGNDKEYNLKLWNVITGKEFVTFVYFNDNEWVWITPDDYFTASPKGAKELTVCMGNKIKNINEYMDQ